LSQQKATFDDTDNETLETHDLELNSSSDEELQPTKKKIVTKKRTKNSVKVAVLKRCKECEKDDTTTVRDCNHCTHCARYSTIHVLTVKE